jgi:hypothetical protein
MKSVKQEVDLGLVPIVKKNVIYSADSGVRLLIQGRVSHNVFLMVRIQLTNHVFQHLKDSL